MVSKANTTASGVGADLIMFDFRVMVVYYNLNTRNKSVPEKSARRPTVVHIYLLSSHSP